MLESDFYMVLVIGRIDYDIEFYLNKYWIIVNCSLIVVEGKVVGVVFSFCFCDEINEFIE